MTRKRQNVAPRPEGERYRRCKNCTNKRIYTECYHDEEGTGWDGDKLGPKCELYCFSSGSSHGIVRPPKNCYHSIPQVQLRDYDARFLTYFAHPWTDELSNLGFNDTTIGTAAARVALIRILGLNEAVLMEMEDDKTGQKRDPQPKSTLSLPAGKRRKLHHP
jgi:hypothetical protein